LLSPDDAGADEVGAGVEGLDVFGADEHATSDKHKTMHKKTKILCLITLSSPINFKYLTCLFLNTRFFFSIFLKQQVRYYFTQKSAGEERFYF